MLRRSSQRGEFFLFAFLCVSEHFEFIETHLFFTKIFVSAKARGSEATENASAKHEALRSEATEYIS